eukprot:754555-Hanusia_phi.AAC.1
MEHLVEENAFLKKQLMGQGRLPPAPAQASTLPATPLTVKPIQASSSKTSKGSIALAVVLFAGMCFTSVDIVQVRMMTMEEAELVVVVVMVIMERLPQLYVPRSSAVEFSSIPYPDSEHGAEIASLLSFLTCDVTGRKGGRVLLSVAADDETRSAYSLDRKQLLIVTLLDHLVGQIQAPASLFSRLCYKLVDMEVLSSCDFLPDIDTVRHRYLAEFKELNEEFVKDKDEVHVDAEFTFSTSSNALTKSIDAVPTRFRTMPLPGSPSSNALRELLKSKAASTFRSDFNVLCPEAQLLIADKPANDMSVSARLIRKQVSPPPSSLLSPYFASLVLASSLIPSPRPDEWHSRGGEDGANCSQGGRANVFRSLDDSPQERPRLAGNVASSTVILSDPLPVVLSFPTAPCSLLPAPCFLARLTWTAELCRVPAQAALAAGRSPVLIVQSSSSLPQLDLLVWSLRACEL